MTDILYSKEKNQYYLKDADGITPVDDVKQTDKGEYIVDYGDGNYVNLEKEYEPSFYDYAQQVVGQGTLMGIGDEIAGTVKGLYEGLTTDKSVGDAINQNIDAERERMAKTEASLGMPATLALQGGGGLLTGGLGLGRALARQGLSKTQQVLRGSGIGGVQGGVTGAGMAEGNLLDPEGLASRGIGLGIGTVGGAIGGGLLTGLGQQVGKVLSATERKLPGGADRQTARVLQQVIPRKAVPRMERELGKMSRGVPMDVAPLDAQRLAGAAIRSIGGGRQQEILKARQKGQASRFDNIIDKIVSPQSGAEMLETLAKDRQLNANKQYSKVYEQEVPLTKELKNLYKTNAVKKSFRMAKMIADDENVNLPNLVTKTKEGEAFVKPTARMLDYMKQGLDAYVDAQYRISGPLGRSAQNVRNRFRDHLDAIIPGYKDARSTYAGFSAAIEALENGVNYMRSSLGDELSSIKDLVSKSDIEKLKLNDHEYQSFRSGIAAVLKDKVKGKPFEADVTKIFNTPKILEKLNIALGKKDAKALINEIRKEAKQAQSFAETQGSASGQRISAQQSLEKPMNVMALGGDPTLIAANAMAQTLNRLNPPPEVIARNISRLMASPKIEDQMQAFRLLKNRDKFEPMLKVANRVVGTKPRSVILDSLAGGGGYLGGYLGGNVGGQLGTGQ